MKIEMKYSEEKRECSDYMKWKLGLGCYTYRYISFKQGNTTIQYGLRKSGKLSVFENTDDIFPLRKGILLSWEHLRNVRKIKELQNQITRLREITYAKTK